MASFGFFDVLGVSPKADGASDILVAKSSCRVTLKPVLDSMALANILLGLLGPNEMMLHSPKCPSVASFVHPSTIGRIARVSVMISRTTAVNNAGASRFLPKHAPLLVDIKGRSRLYAENKPEVLESLEWRI